MTTDTKTREMPILFSAPMVHAIITGRKSQTRRVVSKSNSETSPPWSWLEFDDSKVIAGAARTFADNGYLHVSTRPNPDDIQDDPGWWTLQRVYPRWEDGDRMWVRETWTQVVPGLTAGQWHTAIPPRQNRRRSLLVYLASVPDGDHPPRWRSPIHMPRWASRITLEVTGVRVERLQDITEADAQAEGVERPILSATEIGGVPVHPMTGYYRDGFRVTWDALNSKRGHSWESNPWVWVVSFRRI